MDSFFVSFLSEKKDVSGSDLVLLPFLNSIEYSFPSSLIKERAKPYIWSFKRIESSINSWNLVYRIENSLVLLSVIFFICISGNSKFEVNAQPRTSVIPLFDETNVIFEAIQDESSSITISSSKRTHS